MKYVLFTDIHFGKKSNSDEFNQQCLDFLKFIEDTVNEIHIDGAIFLGDWFDSRNAINVKTLKYGIEGIYSLGNIGKGNSYMILGNHDLYYKDRRDISSIVIPEGDIGVEVIDEPIMVDDMLLCPWLLDEEKLTDLIKQYNPQYVFGHFEIPSFSFNKLSKYDGEYNPSEYQGPKRILSGHFHMRQEKNNITYIGNCFSHDFSDANDYNNKGFAVLDTETNKIDYYEWEEAPKYVVSKISELQKLKITSNMYLKIINDVNLTPKDLNTIKTQMETLKDIKSCYIESKNIIIMSTDDNQEIEHLGNVNDLIIKLLSDIDISNINANMLVDIYKNLPE